MKTEISIAEILINLQSLGQIRIKFDYINFRGEFSHRKANITSIWYGSNEYHTTPQWIMTGLDLDKNQTRHFAMSDMTNVKYAGII
jgi:hypothetical protein